MECSCRLCASTGEHTPETTGTARLAEALQAHVWPHITMKSDSVHKAAASSQSLTKELLSEDEKLLAEGCAQEQDPGGESFEELFAKFADMKGTSYYPQMCSSSMSSPV